MVAPYDHFGLGGSELVSKEVVVCIGPALNGVGYFSYFPPTSSPDTPFLAWAETVGALKSRTLVLDCLRGRDVRFEGEAGHVHQSRSVSEGTLKTRDLFEAFISELNRLEPLSRRLRSALVGWPSASLEEEDEIVADIFGYLGEYAGPGFYFGALSGNDSDFGFWRVDGRKGK